MGARRQSLTRAEFAFPPNRTISAKMSNLKIQIVVVGGGAGGLQLAARLGARYGRERFDIILLERNRTHIWKPLLHEVAAGSLDANLDEVGYGAHAKRWGYRYFQGALKGIDREKRQVIVAPLVDEDGTELTDEHRIRYDYLVLAIGSVSNDFGVEGVKEHCLSLESRRDADSFRQRLLNQCLRCSRRLSANPEADEFVRIAIVGGGATGVELAAELYNSASALRYYGLEVFDEKRLKVSLLEAGPRILPALPEKLAEAAHNELEALGVEIVTGAQVSSVTPGAIDTKDGKTYPADLKVWAAGVKAPDFLASIAGLETNRNNQLIVRETLQTTRDDRIFALGDCASCTLPGMERPVPPRAQSAHQMSATVFANISALISGSPLKAFRYEDKGSLISMSQYATVGTLMGNLVGGRMAIEGRLARFVYVSLYRMHLMAIHGWFKGLGLIAMGHVNQVMRPKLKLH
jgi:NADH:ubiquinone reductase (H+-translocating)